MVDIRKYDHIYVDKYNHPTEETLKNIEMKEYSDKNL